MFYDLHAGDCKDTQHLKYAAIETSSYQKLTVLEDFLTNLTKLLSEFLGHLEPF